MFEKLKTLFLVLSLLSCSTLLDAYIPVWVGRDGAGWKRSDVFKEHEGK